MRPHAHSLLACAVAWLLGCSLAPIDLDGKACPCVDGYTCVDSVCVRGQGISGGTGGDAAGGEGGGATGGDLLPGDGDGDGDIGDGDGDGDIGDGDGDIGDGDGDIGDGDGDGDGDAVIVGDGDGDGDGDAMCPDVTPVDPCPSPWEQLPDGACRLTCVTPGCAQAIDCPPGRPCILNCTFPSACTGTVLNCGDAPCHIRCNASSCTPSTLKCGAGPCSCDSGPTIECGDSCDCPASCG